MLASSQKDPPLVVFLDIVETPLARLEREPEMSSRRATSDTSPASGGSPPPKDSVRVFITHGHQGAELLAGPLLDLLV